MDEQKVTELMKEFVRAAVELWPDEGPASRADRKAQLGAVTGMGRETDKFHHADAQALELIGKARFSEPGPWKANALRLIGDGEEPAKVDLSARVLELQGERNALREVMKAKDAKITELKDNLNAWRKNAHATSESATQFEQRVAELEAGIRAEINAMPDAVIVREGGADEDVLKSLAVSVGKLKHFMTANAAQTWASTVRAQQRAEQRAEKAEARVKELIEVCKQLNREKNTHFSQGCENLKRVEKAEADRDRWRETVEKRRDLFVRVCQAAGVSTDADEDDLVRAFAGLRAERDEITKKFIGLTEKYYRLHKHQDSVYWKQSCDLAEAERDKLRGYVAALREAISKEADRLESHRHYCLTRGRGYAADVQGVNEQSLRDILALSPGAPEATVIKAAEAAACQSARRSCYGCHCAGAPTQERPLVCTEAQKALKKAVDVMKERRS